MRARLADEREQGFTLIELLVVIIIIGVLAAIAIPVFLNQRKKGVDASVKSDLRNLATVMETYLVDNPGVNGTNVPADLAAFKKSSPSTMIYATYNDTTGGYCLASRNPGQTVNAAGQYLWWDSAAGGLLSPTQSVAIPAGAQSCQASRAAWSTTL